MRILITGCCGFIGFNFANSLAKTNKKIRVVGIDNFSDYYSVNYKKKYSSHVKSPFMVFSARINDP